MYLDRTIQKNNLHIKKFIVKGFAENENNSYIIYYLESVANVKYELTISLTPFKIISFSQVEKFTIPNLVNEIFKYYKPLGYLETNFKLEMKNDYTKVDSAIFVVKENKDGIFFDFIEKDRFFNLSEKNFIKFVDTKVWVPNKVIVHDEKMHADDILSVALLKYVNKNIEIIRTRNIPEDFDGVVVDVGNGRYDHHDLNKFRINVETGEPYVLPNGEEEVYAAFGLLAKDILPGLIGLKSYYTIDHQIIRSLDAADNYGYFSDLSYMFSLFNPAWNEDVSVYDKFIEAVDFGIKIITEMINKEKAKQLAIPYVQNCIKNMKNNILVLDKRAPWVTAAKKSNALLTIFPTDNGSYALQCIPDRSSDARTKINKIDLPAEWIDNPPDGMIFIHKSLYFSTFDTFDNAYNAALFVVENK